MICRDFQNQGCDRTFCKFLHFTRKEQTDFAEKKIIPEHRGRSDKITGISPDSPFLAEGYNGQYGGGYAGEYGQGNYGNQDPHGGYNLHGGYGYDASGGYYDAPAPPCKDYMNSRCSRGNDCRFRHVTERQLDMERRRADSGGGGPHMVHGGSPHHMGGPPMYGKRPRISGPPPAAAVGGMTLEAALQANAELTKQVTDLKKQMLELREMNDTLYEQNNKYKKEQAQAGSEEVQKQSYAPF